ncbi:hypothetical protein Vretifemale_4237, partial [Volvox reticuliferus]
SGFSSLVSLLVLPSLAVDEMREDAAAAIRGIGHAASRFASRGLQREQSGALAPVLHSQPQPHAPILKANTSSLTRACQPRDPRVAVAVAADPEATFEERQSRPARTGSTQIQNDRRVGRDDSVVAAAAAAGGAEADFGRYSQASETGFENDTSNCYSSRYSCRNDHSSSERPLSLATN